MKIFEEYRQANQKKIKIFSNIYQPIYQRMQLQTEINRNKEKH